MNYLQSLTDEEIRYICSVIPQQDSILYFKKYPKDFAKVVPGFRPQGLRSQEQICTILFRNRTVPYISSFLEKHISRWLYEIQREIEKNMERGESKESAWLKTFPLCFFVDNISIYLKLTSAELSDEYISLLSHSIKRIRDINEEKQKIDEKQREYESSMSRYEDEISRIQNDIQNASKKLREYSVDNDRLKHINAGLEALREEINSRELEIETHREKILERDECIRQLKNELSLMRIEKQQLEKRMNEKAERETINRHIGQSVSSNVKCPRDMDEFKDNIRYNLENLGIVIESDYYSLLLDYITDVLFTGKPILISRTSGRALMKCVSNALVGKPDVMTSLYSPDVTMQDIESLLGSSERIVCFDNYIGNYDEMIIASVVEKYKGKIVFLTVAYDRTLRYVSDEFMKYCHYASIARIAAFSNEKNLTEDPTFTEETDVSRSVMDPDKVWSDFLKDVLVDIGVSRSLAEYKSSLVTDEDRLIRLLSFDILPYCMDVLNVEPFSVSERLNKYVGDNGHCQYKNLLRRWFS